MLSESIDRYFRLLVPFLVGWVAVMVWRAPWQQRSNRLLGAFLFVIAFGFTLEFLWLAIPSAQRWYARLAENIVGLADPPILLAYCLLFPQAPRRWSARGFTLAYVAVAALLLASLAAAPNWSSPPFAWKWVEFLYITGTYLAAFLVAAHRFLVERRRLMRRQLFLVALGTGFVALSRMSAVVPGGLLGPMGSGTSVLGGILAILATAGLAWAFTATRWPHLARRSPELFVPLLALLAMFSLAWAFLFLALSGRAISLLFPFRWVFFATLAGYGILRHQVFDLEAETWKTVAYALAVAVGIALTATTREAVGGVDPASPNAFHPLALAAGLGAALALYPLLSRLRGWLGVGQLSIARERDVLLDIYESTLEHAVDPRRLTPAERRLVETLRDLLGVSPEEQERILARLSRALAQGPAAPAPTP